MKKPLAAIECPQCHDMFEPRTNRQTYCSMPCWPSQRVSEVVRITTEQKEALRALSGLVSLAKKLGVYRAES